MYIATLLNTIMSLKFEVVQEFSKTRDRQNEALGRWQHYLTFGERIGLNDIKKRVDHVEKDAYAPWLVVSMGIIYRRWDKPKVQRLHRRRGAPSGGVRQHLSPGFVLLLRRPLLAAGSPPAEQQNEPPYPQHGSANVRICSSRKDKRRRRAGRRYGEGGMRRAANTSPSRSFIPAAQQPGAQLQGETSNASAASSQGPDSSLPEDELALPLSSRSPPRGLRRAT